MKYSYQILIAIFLLISQSNLFAQCPAPIKVSIDNIITTESRCNTSGTATIQASNGIPPFTYSIISGPVLASPQSTNLFQALSQGNYVVLVTDNCNESVTQNFSITGSYETPELNVSLQSPTCQGGSNGTVTIDVTKGREPFSYSLINPSPIIAGPQSSNIFTNLVAGNYTCKVTDSCNNFQTRNFTLLDGVPQNLNISNTNLKYKACDSFAIPFYISNNSFAPLNFPITVTLTISNNLPITKIISSSVDPIFLYDSFLIRHHHITGTADITTMTATDACGNTTTFSNPQFFMTYLDMYPSEYAVSGCSRQFTYKLDDLKDNSSPYLTPHCNTISYTLISPANVVLATQINNSTFTGYPPGIGYKVIREDCCQKDTLVFTWKETPPLNIIYEVSSQYTCKENTSGLKMVISLGSIAPLTVTLVSGPPSITFPDGTIKNYVYPDTIVKKDPTGGLILNYLTVGTYRFETIDTCGQVFNFNVTVKPSDLRHSSVSTKVERGCVNDNKIIYTTKSNTGAFFAPEPGSANLDVTEVSGSSRVINQDDYKDSVINLAPGTYHLNYHYDNAWRQSSIPIRYVKGMETMSCDSIIDTTIVPLYTQPLFTTPLAIAVCNETRNVALLPDSSKGVPPYQYQITAGPITTAVQNSPVFPNLVKGVYTFRMADLCGNSYSSSIAIDTLVFPDIATIGDPCKGGSVIFKAPSSPYYFYLWERPNGTFSIKDTLMINEIADADTGYYKLTIISLINGCSDSKTRTLHFNYCFPVPVKLVSFNGFMKDNAAVLSWQTTNEMNAAYFYIESSNDGIHFTQLQKINALNSDNNSYSYTDNKNLNAVNFYRLAQYDKDGKVNYSGIIKLSSINYALITVGPNPVKNTLTIQWQSKQNISSTINISDASGKLIINKKVLLVKGNNLISLPMQSIADGTYIATLKNKDVLKNIKFVKQ